MAAIIEAVLTEEKLLSLLDEGHEQPALDYKETLDVSDTRDLVSVTKDIMAMLSNEDGGYIVVGVDNDGKPVGSLTPRQVTALDESRLRSMVAKYITEPFEIRSAHHVIAGCSVMLIYVAPSPHGFYVVTRNGEYEVTIPSTGKIKKEFEFRVGQVFVRRGTASQPWGHTDRTRIIEQVVEGRKEQWRSEMRHEWEAMLQHGLTGQRLQQLPLNAMSWKLDAETFDQLALELMRRNDTIPLRHTLLQVASDCEQMTPESVSDFPTLLARTVSIAALATTFEQHQWFDHTLDALARIYEAGGPQAGHVELAQRRLLIAAHVYALGGLAVRVRNWTAVRSLATQTMQGNEFDYYRNWLRHAIVRAARAELLDEPNPGLIARAHNVVRVIPALHPDTDANSDRVLDSVCQFDALTGVVFLADPDTSGSPSYSPNFARYYQHRTEPVFTELATNAAMRSIVAGDDDARIAAAVADIDAMAQKVGSRYDGWAGFSTGSAVRRFTERHATETPDHGRL